MKTVTQLLLILIVVFLSCEKNMNSIRDIVSFDEAKKHVIADAVAQDSMVLIYGKREIVNRGQYYTPLYGSVFDTLNVRDDSWLFLVDYGYPFVRSGAAEFVMVNILSGKIVKEYHDYPEDLEKYDVIYPVYREPLTKERAKNEFLKMALPEKSKSAIYMLPEMVKAGTHIMFDSTDKDYLVDSDSWLFFIDQFYIRHDWPRPCNVYLMDVNTGIMTNYMVWGLPSNLTALDTIYRKWERANRLLPNLNFTAQSRQLGCCNFMAYSQNEDETALIRLHGDTTKLNFVNDSLEFDIQSPPEKFEFILHHYYYLPVNYTSPIQNMCEDYGGFTDIAPHEWTAESGTVRITREKSDNPPYWYTFELLNFILKNSEIPDTLHLEYHKIDSMGFGYCAG